MEESSAPDICTLCNNAGYIYFHKEPWYCKCPAAKTLKELHQSDKKSYKLYKDSHDTNRTD